ncbi:ABC transporter permease [Rhizobium sp. LC145]|jgi:peptide/nickel transport system permease protein|uniref:ABC transporter permease n=1 Tax=Rhizobium sp. LC145 TaxID=1120688 RepID=UPI00062A4F59|nr:ABC transporter permease [Rhizobium sp. LC145]KKX24502.1 peptide ABC transporter [Rhizobium sp. LC145]TKT46580.1 ABC transporter permease [Rhizobiaceae bacterium LC148]
MHALSKYIAKRLLWTLPTLLIVAVMVFFLVRMIPGDPAQLILGDGASPEEVASLRTDLGLDQPVPVQFVYWLGNVIQGDLGQSISNGAAVLPLMLDRFQVSATIVLVAVGLATLIAIPAGLIAAWRQNDHVDIAVVAVSTLLMSVPSFWLGLVLLLAFGLKLGWLPVVGFVPFTENPWTAITYVILPVVTLMLIEVGVLTRMMRASAIEILRLEYVMHARAKGLSERKVLLRHVLPNAFAPTWTMIGLVLGGLLGGIAVLETVFTLPGLGRLLVDAIFARDYPVVQGCLLFTAVIYVIVNLIVDLCYPLFDPRVTAS